MCQYLGMLLSLTFRVLFISLALMLISGCGKNSPSKSPADKSAVTAACLNGAARAVYIPAGSMQMGSERGYPEERPVRTVDIAAFEIDATEVTNAQFAMFVEETGYVTSAEKIQPGFETSGGAVFTLPDPTNPTWWRFVEGANWRHPEGPDSLGESREHDPVVQISHDDAKAYAAWAGRALPSEAQWEYAARAGSQTRYIWGETRTINGEEQANTWQGAFPIENTQEDGFLKRSPVGCYPPNAFGLYDMIGNVWEWTDTVYQQSEGEPVYVIKGGSFLCAENYCRRYRPAARQPQEAGFPTNHIGFRTVRVE